MFNCWVWKGLLEQSLSAVIGQKKAKTKSRILNENVNMAVIDEKFQINTVMEVDSSGRPTKEKMVEFDDYLIIYDSQS